MGTDFAFQAPVASASIPEIVGKEQLPSAIALGGIQMNLAGIIGPALGGLLIPLFGVSTVFATNAFGFVLVLLAVITWKRKSIALDTPLEGFLDSLAGADNLGFRALDRGATNHTGLDPRPPKCHTHDGVAGGYLNGRTHVGRACNHTRSTAQARVSDLRPPE